ncbi:hypothetical protein ID866_7485 [Astraeus odoratus]|nr:hypothetical protein ID866_7485 [Astraeus odoratus]
MSQGDESTRSLRSTVLTLAQNAVVKTGQIYAFHADTRRLGIRKYAPYPPRNLTASLGRELEKYDQLCDAIETQLLHAIAVLKRDLSREECRAREAEMAALAAQAASNRVADTGSLTADTSMQPPPTPMQGSPQGPTLPSRRQSAISLSSLHRPPFPLKLDLSSSSMRMTAEEVALFSKGLVPSPVSLAPKSARPTSTADIDLMAAFASAAANASAQHVDIDLTVDDSPPTMMTGINTSLGSSADKPIELDLDGIDMEMSSMTDLFGDAPESSSGDGLFTPTTTDAGAPLAPGDAPLPKDAKAHDNIGMEILNALTVEGDNHGPNLFAAMQGNSSSERANNANQQGTQESSINTLPGSILASFATQSQLDPGAEHMQPPFDLSGLDFSTLDSSIFGSQSSDNAIMDMDVLLNMHQTTDNSEVRRDLVHSSLQ